MTAPRTRRRRDPWAVVLGWIAGALAAVPALALAPWLLIGVAWGWTGSDATGVTGETDWGQVLGSGALLLVTVAVPVVLGIAVCRGLDLLLRTVRARRADPV